MATLLNINGIDFTNNVKADSYVVNAAKVYSEWTDANGVNHRQIIRERISGTFEMAFASMDEYSQFIEHMEESETTGGYIPVYGFVNNKSANKSFNAFFEYDPTILQTGSGEIIKPFKVKITER